MLRFSTGSSTQQTPWKLSYRFSKGPKFSKFKSIFSSKRVINVRWKQVTHIEGIQNHSLFIYRYVLFLPSMVWTKTSKSDIAKWVAAGLRQSCRRDGCLQVSVSQLLRVTSTHNLFSHRLFSVKNLSTELHFSFVPAGALSSCFAPWSGGSVVWSIIPYTKRLQVCSLVRVQTGGHWSMFLSHMYASISFSLSWIKKIYLWVRTKKIFDHSLFQWSFFSRILFCLAIPTLLRTTAGQGTPDTNDRHKQFAFRYVFLLCSPHLGPPSQPSGPSAASQLFRAPWLGLLFFCPPPFHCWEFNLFALITPKATFKTYLFMFWHLIYHSELMGPNNNLG